VVRHAVDPRRAGRQGLVGQAGHEGGDEGGVLAAEDQGCDGAVPARLHDVVVLAEEEVRAFGDPRHLRPIGDAEVLVVGENAVTPS
jgi:hypothetical protein